MANNPEYDVVFRGDLAPGETLAAVRERLGELFRLDEDRLGQLFSGRPVVLKRGLDSEGAERYRQVLRRAGALVQVRPAMGAASPPRESTSPRVAASQPPAAAALDVAPAGAELLRPEERRVYEPLELPLDHLSLAEAGADLLRAEERRRLIALELDLSHLSLTPQGSASAGEPHE